MLRDPTAHSKSNGNGQGSNGANGTNGANGAHGDGGSGAGAALLERTTVVVPFRLGSARFPRKALASFRGQPLLWHAVAHAAELSPRPPVLTAPALDLGEVLQMVDLDSAAPQGVEVVPSSASCSCATERVVQIYQRLDSDVVMTLPVDEPAIDPAALRRALAGGEALFGNAGALTFYCEFFCEADFETPLSAKVVLDRQGYLLYMSRSGIPLAKDGTAHASAAKKNVGAFVFSRSFLEALAEHDMVSTTLDCFEGLEQLRWLELGLRVRCLPVEHVGFGVDVPAQLEQLERRVGTPTETYPAVAPPHEPPSHEPPPAPRARPASDEAASDEADDEDEPTLVTLAPATAPPAAPPIMPLATGPHLPPPLPLEALGAPRAPRAAALPDTREIRIETSTACCYRCKMCPRDSLTRKQQIMPHALFESIVRRARAEIPALTMCTVSGFGDFCCDPNWRQKLALARQLFDEVHVVTTLSRVDDEDIVLLSRLATEVRVSLYATTEATYRHVHCPPRGVRLSDIERRILTLRRAAGARLTMTCCELAENSEEIPAWITRWSDVAGRVEVWRPHNWVDGRAFRAIAPAEQRLASCGRPASGPIQVQVDGTVNVCCFDYDGKMIVGDLKRQSFADIFGGELLRRIRELHACGRADELGLCAVCDQRDPHELRADQLVYSSVGSAEERVLRTSSGGEALREQRRA